MPSCATVCVPMVFCVVGRLVFAVDDDKSNNDYCEKDCLKQRMLSERPLPGLFV